MSPEHAKVFIAEDDEDYTEMYEEVLQEGGHVVVRKAATLKEAMSTIEELEKGDINVALVDGNLNEFDSSGKDGARVTKAIKEKDANVTVIGVSGLSAPWADKSVRKYDIFDELNDAVTNA